jgi:hypothetical protein
MTASFAALTAAKAASICSWCPRIRANQSLPSAAACSHLKEIKPPCAKEAPRAQLSIGYSLLYQEADGIQKPIGFPN